MITKILLSLIPITIIVGFVIEKIKENKNKKIEENRIEEKRKQYQDKRNKLEEKCKFIQDFIKENYDIGSTIEIYFYDSRDIHGEFEFCDSSIRVHYTFENFSDSFNLYVEQDERSIKNDIRRVLDEVILEHEKYKNNKIFIEEAQSESIDADFGTIANEYISGKVIYKNETSVKEIINYLSEKFSYITNFSFEEKKHHYNKYMISGFSERKFTIERTIFLVD